MNRFLLLLLFLGGATLWASAPTDRIPGTISQSQRDRTAGQSVRVETRPATTTSNTNTPQIEGQSEEEMVEIEVLTRITRASGYLDTGTPTGLRLAPLPNWRDQFGRTPPSSRDYVPIVVREDDIGSTFLEPVDLSPVVSTEEVDRFFERMAPRASALSIDLPRTGQRTGLSSLSVSQPAPVLDPSPGSPRRVVVPTDLLPLLRVPVTSDVDVFLPQDDPIFNRPYSIIGPRGSATYRLE